MPATETTIKRTAKSARLGLRAAPEQESVLRRAAAACHKSLTQFIIDMFVKPPSRRCWINHALQAQNSGSGRTFVVAENDRVVGCYSLTVGQVDTLQAPNS